MGPRPLGRRTVSARIMVLLAVALGACSEVQAPRGEPWGVRTTLAADGAWQIRWQGRASVTVDGLTTAADGVLRLPADRSSAVRVGRTAFTVWPRREDPCAPARFVVLGDGRASVDGVGPSAYWAPMLAEAVARAPLFVLNTGDLVKNGEDRAEWDRYLRTLPPWPPVLAVRGNHDRGPHFADLGMAPADVFALRAGPIALVAFDSEGTDAEVRARLPRVEAALAAAAEAPFRVVAMHRPVWSRGNHGSDDRGLVAALVPLLERHDVALVLSGHDHDYERFCPSLGLGPSRRCVAATDGVTYVVSGGAATFTVPVPGLSRRVDPAVAVADEAASRIFSAAHHMVEIEAVGGRLVGRAWRTRAGNIGPPGLLDVFEITRESSCPR